ncbi:hypothetical protein NliqN6_1506 [Naganishia liquefaciens]|uniref:Man(5)GlcNAc(2)-PP-dolichol translocation protein RFT1 n=1 Tax=Naganishia liquefaciens TaxID=104408 RepID=A0A8H3YDB0_9TREE|nr:hypothetical protein NliqN6_1506 [Naganishia liquefaciens]
MADPDSLHDEPRHASPPPPPRTTHLASSLTSAKSLIALQLVSRLITFSLNQALIRIASPKVFGTAAVQFDLVRDTILFLAREGVRSVVVRIPGESKVEERRDREWIEDDRVHNLINLPLGLGLAVAAGLLPLYLQSLPITTTSQPCFHAALGIYVSATLIELATEPFYLIAQLSSPVNTGLRVQAEGTAIVIRAVVTVASLAAANERYALLAFAAGQMAYSLALQCRYAYAYWQHAALWRIPFRRTHHQAMLLPRPKASSSLLAHHLYSHHVRLLGALLGQSTIKHFLTEADRIVVAWASPLEDQGGYAVASNYASLVARIVFQPVEESARLYFAREVETMDPAHAEPSHVVRASPFLLLFSMFRISVYLVLLCVSFVPPMAPIVFPYLLPRAYRLTSAQQTLTAYLTLYLPILGMNGILEAFFAATSGVWGLGKQSGVMVVSSGAFAGTLMFLARVRHGWVSALAGSRVIALPPLLAVDAIWLRTWTNPEVSLVYANAISMLVRIVFAFRHALHLTDVRLGLARRKEIRMIPAVWNVVVLGILASLVRALTGYASGTGRLDSFPGQAVVLGATALIALVCLGAIYLDEKPRWRAAIQGILGDERKRQ